MYSKWGSGLTKLAASIALLTYSETLRMMASVMADMKLFKASSVTYASRSGEGGPTARGFARELSEASYTSGGAEY